FEIDIAVLVQCTDVSGFEPLAACDVFLFVTPVTWRDILPAHQNLAVFSQFYLLSRQRSADRSPRRFEWMIHADNRCRLGHAVACNQGNAEPSAKILVLRVE